MVTIRHVSLIVGLILLLSACTDQETQQPTQNDDLDLFQHLSTEDDDPDEENQTDEDQNQSQEAPTSDNESTTPLEHDVEDSDLQIIEDDEVLEKIMFVVQDDVKIDSVLNDYNSDIHDIYEEMNMATVFMSKEEIRKLTNDPRVTHVEYDKVVEISPVQVVEWSQEDVQSPAALSSHFTGRGVKVAVIDSGISPHEDLEISGGVSMVNYTNSYRDDNGHGTHVAGIIGARDNDRGIVGVAPESEIYAVKVLDQDGYGYMSDVIAGVDWSIQQGVDVINLSLGSERYSPIFENLVNAAASEDIVIIAAAGNDGTPEGIENNVSYPARYDHAIGVGAIDQDQERADFSSTGSTVELAAPGVDILSTYLNNHYVRMDGTSSASPFVAGVAALLKQINPNQSFAEIRRILQTDSIDLGDEGRDPWYGFGLVQSPYYFRDVHGHWAKPDILATFEREWMIGGANQYFRPQNNLTRAQAAVIFSRILNLDGPVEDSNDFTDVPNDHWAIQEIQLVAESELMIGGANQKFHPNNYLTREQMVVILYRALSPETTDTTNPFTDIEDDRWSVQEISTMYNLEVVRGINETTFAPTNSLTRAQMAVMLNRIMPYFEEEDIAA
ncbi:S8 family peptidase [Alkalibacillus aidingensis]|uniref:S8 family peptidase n=1 Tax=Alkalibacillus aidingensis TaxID=2747607 RepID=UPI00166153E7|nr:S8 family serine peptidase [Alkalibacillus aidingensis]